MAQRRRPPAPKGGDANAFVNVNGRQGDANSSSTASPSRNALHLDPAPQHPLYPSTSPSRPSFATSHSARLRKATTASSAESRHWPQIIDGARHDDERPKLTTMDRLEGWFGLGRGDADPQSVARPKGSTSSSSATTRKTIANATKLVLVHIVTAGDSLEGLALRYNTDVRTLRRVNGLWPGDSVQVRKEVYVPVSEDAAQAHSDSVGGPMQACEEPNGKLRLLLNGLPRARQGRSLSVTSAASSEAASSVSHLVGSASDGGAAAHTSLPSPELRRVPTQALSYFPPPGTNDEKGNRQSSFAFGADVRPENDMDVGESGVEDLLQLAERARLRGSEASSSTSPPPISGLFTTISATSTDADGMSAGGSARDGRASMTSSPAISTRALDDDWKPNRYTLGQRRRQNTSALSQHHQSSTSDDNSTLALAAAADRGPAMMAAVRSGTGNDYRGWNDIPEPPLHRTAKGQVAHAYKPKRRYPRPGEVVANGLELPGSGLIEDLAAGLPPNPGPAANWARPIGDCLPVPADAQRRHASKISSASNASHASSSSSNWGQILSDTVRGKMRLEDALERGLEDIRAGLTGAGATPAVSARLRPAASAQTLSHSYAPSRPSAETARAALSQDSTLHQSGGDAGGGLLISEAGRRSTRHTNGAKGKSANVGLSVEAGNGPTMRRSSGRSLHELEDLRVQREEDDDGQHGGSKTWSAAGSRQMAMVGEGGSTPQNLRGRRNVRDVGWQG